MIGLNAKAAPQRLATVRTFKPTEMNDGFERRLQLIDTTHSVAMVWRG